MSVYIFFQLAYLDNKHCVTNQMFKISEECCSIRVKLSISCAMLCYQYINSLRSLFIRRANARNVRLYYGYWQYTDHFIVRFVSPLSLRSTLHLLVQYMPQYTYPSQTSPNHPLLLIFTLSNARRFYSYMYTRKNACSVTAFNSTDIRSVSSG